MLTKSDKSWAEGKFATKDELRAELKNLTTKDDLTASNVRLGVEFDKKIDVLREESRSDHDEVMTALDEVMRELVRGREQVFA